MTTPTETSVNDNQPGFTKWTNGATLFAGIGAVISLVLMFASGAETGKYMLNSWVYGFIFWLLVTLGCLGLSLLHNSIKSSWTLAVLRIFEAGASWQMFVVMFICFLPVLFNLPKVYEWADPAHLDTVLKWKQPYLNVPFFIARLIGYFAFFIWITSFMRRSTVRHDQSQDKKEFQLRSNWATPSMVIYVIALTFLMTDIGMSLNPHWMSTIYGVWLMVGGCQAALALATVLICTNAKKKPYSDVMSPALTKDLGNMMFVLTMLWGYTSVSQLIILWNGNLPETATFFAVRGSDYGLGWNAIGASTILGCFFIPFVTLLAPRVKKYPERLAKIAGLIFVFRMVDIFWVIGASVPHRQWNTAVPTIHDIVGLLTMGAIWFAVMLRIHSKALMLPTYDKRLEEAKANAH